jgi:septum formation protein
MKQKKYTLILASESPRRMELLQYLKIPFARIPSNIEEPPHETALKLAELKGLAVLQILEKKPGYGKDFFPVIISSDTQVRLDDKSYGKPKNKKQASDILLALKGKTHHVITAVHLCRLDKQTQKTLHHSFYCTSRVTFSDFSDNTLTNYLSFNDFTDKAGAYGIQGPAATFISHIEGSYTNVMGLPLFELTQQLQLFFDNNPNWKSCFEMIAIQ